MSGYAQPWWREPTKDHWYAFIAVWLGWTLDAFDFTVFLFLLVPIATEFHAGLTLVVLVGSMTMWRSAIIPGPWWRGSSRRS